MKLSMEELFQKIYQEAQTIRITFLSGFEYFYDYYLTFH